MISLNSERILDKVLSKIFGWADEIVLVDSGSTDQTLSIAKKYNCKIFHRDFDGYGTQKQFAVNQASNDWVFSIDTDEVLTEELKQEISEKLNQKKTHQVNGYLVPRTLIFLGRTMYFGKESKMPILRLFNKNFGNFNAEKVHEGIVLNGKIEKLSQQMLHDSYANLDDYLVKFNRYSSLAAQEFFQKGKKASVLKIVFRFPTTFFREYFINLNFLNGYPGFIWALIYAVSPVMKYAKLREMHLKNHK